MSTFNSSPLRLILRTSLLVVFGLISLIIAGCSQTEMRTYFPPADSEGGWRILSGEEEIRAKLGVELVGLDEAFEEAKSWTKNGGLLVLKDGWLVYERYFGKGHHEATANLASIGKSFTSAAMGILLSEQPENFPDGLEQKVYTPQYLPGSAFPLHDPRKSDIKLGQLLAFSAGIRGNNPCYVNGQPVEVLPAGLDGWAGMSDRYALGSKDQEVRGGLTTVKTLWTEPGGGYSYATASIHIVSIVLRQATGMELEDYVRSRIAEPLGWGRFTYGYKDMPEVDHTPGGGGIVVRPTDMLRFGYLLLQGGNWNGKQVVPADYVRQATHRSTYNPHYPYSFQFNINDTDETAGIPTDAFWKSGSGDHFLFVVPSQNLVVWILGGRDSQYSPNNTGLETHPAAKTAEEDRSGWKSPPTPETRSGVLIMRKVLASLKQ